MNVLVALLILLFPAFSWAACGGLSPNLTAASAAQSDVMDCIAAATYGDTISVPSGTQTWTAASQGCTGNSMLCMKKGIKLQGAGAGSTVITLSGAATYGAICYEPDATSISNDQPFEISGFTFDAGGANYAEGIIDVRVSGTTAITKVRIYNNTFKTDGGNGTSIMINGPVRGVAHSNTFTDVAYHIRVMGGNATSWGLNQREYGTVNNFFFEDNTVNFSVGTSSTDSASMVGQGGGVVFRYNTLNFTNNTAANEFFDTHGLQSMSASNAVCDAGCTGSGTCYTETTGGTRCCSEWSQVKTEVYGNAWSALNNASGYSLAFIHRGSWLLMFMNDLTGTYAGASTPAPKFRQYACDECQNPSSPAYSQHVQNTYLWANLWNGTDLAMASAGDYCKDCVGTYTITENVDYWNKAASFDGTAGVGCGTLAARPATCTTGVGYWATTQSCSDLTGMVGANPSTPISGTLYKCTATNTWTAYYTPYTYPHPLRSGSQGSRKMQNVNAINVRFN